MANADLDRARKAFEIIRIFPGIDVHTLSKMLGINYGVALSTLSTMANNGLLVSEDEGSGLHVFDEREAGDGVGL